MKIKYKTVKLKIPFVSEMTQPEGYANDPQMSADYARAILRDLPADQEHFIVIGVNTRNGIVFAKAIFTGAQDACSIDFKIIFRSLILSGSSAFIIAHNHPTGNVSPSAADRKVSTDIRAAGKIIGMEMLDSIIIGDDRFFSFVNSGETLDK